MKKTLTIFIIAISCVMMCSSCATIFCGTRAKITLDSTTPVEKATLTIDGNKYRNVTFPYAVKIRRGFDHTDIKAEAEGYEPVYFQVYKNFNPVSIINLCDILGWGIDAATGAITKPEKKYYEIEFEKKKE